ncbi:MAG: glycoside hydrolase 5 family protein, partial [Armatimonadota bacterium]
MIKLLSYMGVCLMLLGTSAYAGKIVMLRDEFPGSSKVFADELERAVKAGFETRIVDGSSLKTSLDAETGTGTILLLPDGRSFPSEAISSLTAFLKRGNHFFALSGPVFENLLVKSNGKWITSQDLQSELVKDVGRSMVDFSSQDITKWMRISGAMANPTTYTIEPSGQEGIPNALHVQISNLENWDLITSPVMQKPFADEEEVILFWAKGGIDTNLVKVQWVEEDGTRWIAPVHLTDKWQRYALLPSDFRFWPDGSAPGRGTAGDHFNPAKASKLSFIMERGGENPGAGSARSFWISDIRTTKDPTIGLTNTLPLIETISPQIKIFRTQTASARILETGQTMTVDSEVISPISRAPGFGSDALRKWRFIPVAEALGKDGEYKGTAAHLMLNTTGDYAGSVWGAIGFNQDYLEKNSKECVNLAVSMLKRISNGVFLANAGSEHFAYAFTNKTGDLRGDNDIPAFGGYILNLDDKGFEAKLRIDVYSGKDKIISHEFSADVSAVNLKSPQHFVTGNTQLPPGEYRVETSLMNDETVADRISHTFNVVQYEDLAEDAVISQKDGDFYLDGKKWYPLGINYWPRFSAALETKDMYEIHWLASEQYDPEMIEKDLELMKKLRMNTVSIQYTNIIQARPLMDFMARAEKHGIKVHLFIEGLHPLRYSMWGGPTDRSFMETGGGLIKAAHLAQSPAFFAYDLGWEVNVGKYDRRKVFDKEWNKWVIDRYGSIASAVKDWKYTPPVVDGLMTGPTDDQLLQDGDWRIFVAAYRRFFDDEISRGYRTVRENIRTLDRYHLMGARSGYGGTGALFVVTSFPFDLASGTKHVDFTAPEAYALNGDYHSFLKGGLNNAYGRFVSGNKPVFWPEFGVPIMIGLQPADYKPGITPEKREAQLEFYKNMIRLTMETGGSGLAGWWWPGGFRLIENSDFGIIDPDGTPRPSAIEL